jgi:hypothetical protein
MRKSRAQTIEAAGGGVGVPIVIPNPAAAGRGTSQLQWAPTGERKPKRQEGGPSPSARLGMTRL